MRKRILSFILIFMALFALVSCLAVPINNEYISQSSYETNIIETSKEVETSIVTLMTSKKPVASAVIVDIKQTFGRKMVTAITSGSVLKENGSNLTVGAKGFATYDIIENYTYNESYDFGIIQFYTKTNLKAAKFKNSSNLIYDHEIGQSIITLGAIDNPTNYNSVKVGMITNTNLSYNNIEDVSFMHDATINKGDLGSGVFDLNGNMLGINLSTYSKTLDEYNDEYVTGATLAMPVKVFYNVLENITDELMQQITIPDNLFINNQNTVKYVSKYAVEKAYIDENNKLSDKTITVKNGNELASGLVYKIDGNDYWVITKAFEHFTNIEIYSHNFEKLIIKDSYNLDGFYLSIHKVSTPNALPVYNSKAINQLKGTSMIEGQSLLSIGTSLSEVYANTLSRATLSKADYEVNDNLFIHDGILNFGQKGAPIFNLKGELIGFNVEKVDAINSGDKVLLAEGLSYGIKVDGIANAVNYVMDNNTDELSDLAKEPLTSVDNYESLIKDEQLLIDVVSKTRNKTVTVKTSNGHGSGVIYKKEALNDGLYRYSVITNFHVIENYNKETRSSGVVINPFADIIIGFNNGKSDSYVVDYIKSQMYDIAVVRFETKHNLEYVNSKAIDDGIYYNLLKGQTIISLGTPENQVNNGYVSKGNFTGPMESYNSIKDLALIHNTSINPGNSGGPIFDLNGELIGINVAKTTSVFGKTAVGIGTSLNINILTPVIDGFIDSNFTVVGKGHLGITASDSSIFRDDDNVTLPMITVREGLKYVEVPEPGIVVIELNDDFDSFDKLKKHDLITHMDGVRLNSLEDLASILSNVPRNQKSTLTVKRLIDGVFVILQIEIILT